MREINVVNMCRQILSFIGEIKYLNWPSKDLDGCKKHILGKEKCINKDMEIVEVQTAQA